MPVNVVDPLEVVEVEQQHARRHARPLGAREFGGDRIEHVAAVAHAREGIHARALLGLCTAALGREQRCGLPALPLAKEHEPGRRKSDRDDEQDKNACREPGGGEEGWLRALGDGDPAQAGRQIVEPARRRDHTRAGGTTRAQATLARGALWRTGFQHLVTGSQTAIPPQPR